MKNNIKIENERNRKIIRFAGITGSVLIGACNILMFLAHDFKIEAFGLFLICIAMVIASKKEVKKAK